MMKLLAIRLHNFILFALGIIWYGVSPRLWRKAWRDVEEDHLAQVRRAVWELKKQGRVREDRDGRLWPRK